VHGAEDANPGTTPLQANKLYEAIRGTGGTAPLGVAPARAALHVQQHPRASDDRHNYNISFPITDLLVSHGPPRRAKWQRGAIDTGRWHPQHSAMLRKCAEELSDAMREEYLTDPQGRRVRSKRMARFGDGATQVSLWEDIGTDQSRAYGHRLPAAPPADSWRLPTAQNRRRQLQRKLQLGGAFADGIRFHRRFG